MIASLWALPVPPSGSSGVGSSLPQATAPAARATRAPTVAKRRRADARGELMALTVLAVPGCEQGPSSPPDPAGPAPATTSGGGFRWPAPPDVSPRRGCTDGQVGGGAVAAQRRVRVTISPAGRSAIVSDTGSHGKRSGSRVQPGISATAAPAIRPY